MNFLSICQRVNSLSGLHGTYSDVESTKDLQRKISEGVNEQWIALQNLRSSWTFMIRRYSLFNCTQGKETYTVAEVFTLADEDQDTLGTYIKDSFFLDHEPLIYKNPEQFPYIDNTTESKPTWFTIDPHNNTIYLGLPDDAYNFDIYYRAQVQDLFTAQPDPANPGEFFSPNLNIPALPENYHNILVYAGLAAFATFTQDSGMYQQWQMEYEKGLGQLMREYVTSQRIRTRSII